MLHELLLALNGHTGGIFAEEANTGVVKVVEGLPFVHTAETALLNRLCRLATHYIKFNRFLCRFGPGSSLGGTGNEVGCGIYVRSFCQGLDIVLQQYRLALLDIEAKLLADPSLTAASVQTALEEYQLLFPALLALVEQITHNKVHGCSLLEMLYKASAGAVPLVKAAVDKILFVCHVVLYKQLAAWMLHGSCFDKFDEFFIGTSEATTAASVVTDDALDDELDVGGVTGRQLNRIMQLSGIPVQSSSTGSFSIRANLLPAYIPLRTAEKILFIGESVNMFDSRQGDLKTYSVGSLLSDREDEFARDIYDLSQKSSFDLMMFEEVIDKIRSCVAEQLWTLLVERTDLPAHLQTMKDFFLLGRGELWLNFIDQAHTMLHVPPSKTTLHDVNLAFHHAARNVLLEDEFLMQSFKLELESKTGKQDELSRKTLVKTRESGWDLLRLTYTAEWPLHILFTPAVVDRYNILFTFLLRVKRVQLQLQQCWALQMHRRHLHCTGDDSTSAKWWLRNHMAFLVDNLQYYLQVDVIESQFSILLGKVQSTRDFEAIRLAHDQFLASLCSQCFFHMKPVSHCLNEILDLCHSFCGLMSHAEAELSYQEISQMDDVATRFQRQSGLLFKVLSSVRNHQTSPHLAQLLLRIDYNKYFSLAASGQFGREGGQFGSRVDSSQIGLAS